MFYDPLDHNNENFYGKREMDPIGGASKRQLRVASVLRGHLARVLPEVIRWDPFWQGREFSFIDVRMSSDLRLATVLVDFPEKGQEEVCLRHLRSLSPLVQKKIAPLITGRFVPQLRFLRDPRPQHHRVMETVFRSIAEDLTSTT